MKKFKIEITETLQRIIEVDAEDVDEALRITMHLYRNGEIVLGDQDFIDTSTLSLSNNI